MFKEELKKEYAEYMKTQVTLKRGEEFINILHKTYDEFLEDKLETLAQQRISEIANATIG